MLLVKNSFPWSIGIPLCLKQIMVSQIYASHLKVWQTQLSNIASSCFDIDKTLYLTNMTLVLREHCVTPAQVKSYKMSIAVKNVSKCPKATLKRIARTITIQRLSLSTITVA